MPGRQAFPRHERLTRKRDFTAVFEQGRKSVGPSFVCYMLWREGQGRKFGFAVSRRIGKAVVRNRVKRYLREFYRKNRAQIGEDTHVVVVARPYAARLGYVECMRAMERLLTTNEVVRG